MRKYVSIGFGLGIYLLLVAIPGVCVTAESPGEDLDIDAEIIKNSPVLQRWRRKIPNVLEDIKNDPSFRTRVRFGYTQFPSTGQSGGVYFGVEDLFIRRSGVTVSGGYQRAFNGERTAYGADLHYYVRPLGSYVNVAPLLGYRYVQTQDYSTDGVNLGVKLLLVSSRSGAADISFTQSWVSLGSKNEVGISKLSLGYAVTQKLRLSTDIQLQNSREEKDSSVGVILEWMP